MPAFGLSEAGAWVVATSLTTSVWTVLTLGIRIFLRLKINGPFGKDDIACFVATAFGIIYSALTVLQTHYGLGKGPSEVSASTVDKALLVRWVGSFFYILSLACSMLSICLLIARLNGTRRQKWAAYGVAFLTCLWAVTFILAFAFACRLPHPWQITTPGRCINLWILYITVDATRVAIELANIVAAIIMCWGLQMRVRPRLQVVTLFALRLLILPPSVFFSHDLSESPVGVVVTTQIVVHLSIILATVPCAKPFLTVFRNGSLHAPLHSVPPRGQRTAFDGGRSSRYFLTMPARLHRRRKAAKDLAPRTGSRDVDDVTPWEGQTNFPGLVKDYSQTVSEICANERQRSSLSVRSSESSGHGIMKTVSVVVTYDSATIVQS